MSEITHRILTPRTHPLMRILIVSVDSADRFAIAWLVNDSSQEAPAERFFQDIMAQINALPDSEIVDQLARSSGNIISTPAYAEMMAGELSGAEA